ncbi:putative ubiquitin ligase [Trypanosoma grayi]|uniref:putative ubiquitin ligase n=1 Tax=Trypanosoma grayi TaxID=71804 RepID=UPI0004F4B3FF|nr:putative ubiquitin ligase [Trypanosoma grayi]KEG13793.1 putative ubiquitin ligase [Trypanosoma grayi]
MDPTTWTTRVLVAYAEQQNLSNERQNATVSKADRERLEAMVVKDLQTFYATSDSVGEPVARTEALETRAAVLLERRVSPDCAELFREHPEKLQEVVDAGLALLRDALAHDKYKSGRLPLVEWWLQFTVDEVTCRQIASQGTSHVCGRTIMRHEAIVYCRECAVDSLCVMCAECFQNSPCVDHNHLVRYGSGGGICDCGDSSAWNPESFCTRHRGFQNNNDPTTVLSAVQKRWLEVVLRGLAQYHVTIMRLFQMEVQKLGDDERTKWMKHWVDRLLRRTAAVTQLLAKSAESSRRILCLSLMGPALMPRPFKSWATSVEVKVEQPLPCVEEVFLIELELTNAKDLLIWNDSLLTLLDSCVIDPLFRVPFAELLLKYAERISIRHELHVESLMIQVLSVKNVVDALLLNAPHPHWKCVIGRETILHRQLSALLYFICLVSKRHKQLPLSTSPAMYCSHRITNIITSSENTKAIVASRLLFRAWCKLLCLVGSNSNVHREKGDSTSRKYTVLRDHAMELASRLREVFYPVGNMVYSIGMALISGSEPIPAWLQERLQLLPPTWDAVPDPLIDFPEHRQVLEALALPQDASMLLFNANGIEVGGRHRTYLRELLREFVESINATIAKKRDDFAKLPFVLSGEEEERGLSSYDLLNPQTGNPTSFIVPHLRFFVVLVRIWARLHQRQGEVSAECGGSKEPFHCLISEVLEATLWRAEYWLDECLMPLVLLGQVEQGLWRRGDCDVMLRCMFYTSYVTWEMEVDLYMMQLLMLVMPTEEYAIQMLQRHVIAMQGVPSGLCYPSFLRLVLTLCMGECGATIDNEEDLRQALRVRLLHGMATTDEFSVRLAELAAQEFTHVLPGADPVVMLPSILEEIAVPRQRGSERVFQVKDATTLRNHLNLYHPLLRDQHAYDLYDMYTRLARRELMSQEDSEEKGSLPREPHVAFSPPKSRWIDGDEGQREGGVRCDLFRDKVSLLLQTPAVLSVAIYSVQMYVYFVIGNRSEEVSNVVNDGTLVHAVSVLYLAMKACRRISLFALSNTTTTTTTAFDTIDWDAVKTFQQQFMPPSGYLSQELALLYPVKGIMSAVTLKDKLGIPIIPGARADEVLPPPSSTPSPSLHGVTTIAALHQLCTHFRNEKADGYSIVPMAEFILRNVGALSSSFEEEEAAQREARREQEDQKNRSRKERQAAMLQRLRKSNTRNISRLINAADETLPIDVGSNSASTAGKAVADDGVQKKTEADSDPSTSVTASLLLRLMDVECCMCRSPTKESLFLFGNVSSSDTLYRLSFDAEVAHKLNGHVHMCGHAAHRGCVSKTFGRLAGLWERVADTIYGQTSLGPLEFNCPMCIMICTTLCPLPKLTTNATEEKSSSLFEAVNRDIQKEALTCKWTREVVQKMQKAVARAQIGLSPSSTMKADALSLNTEPRDGNSCTWELAGTLRGIRSHMHISLEWVKAGGAVQYNELLTLFTLMSSLDPRLLQENAPMLYEEFTRDGDGLCLLLLRLLQAPGNAVTLLTQHTNELILTSDHAALVPPNSGEYGEAYNGLLMAMWRELSCLTLLKVLLTEANPVQVVQWENEKPILAPLESEGLSTLKGRQCAVLTMLCYLTERSFDYLQGNDPAVSLSSIIQSLVSTESMAAVTLPVAKLMRCKPLSVPYEGPVAWRNYIFHHIFHLADTLEEMVLRRSSSNVCSVCGDSEARLVMCCYCGQSLCVKSALSPPELYDHSRTCGNGNGVYFHLRENLFTVLLTLSDRHLKYRGLYADECARAKAYEFHGRKVSLSDTACRAWLSFWMRSRWGVESLVVRRLVRGNLERL